MGLFHQSAEKEKLEALENVISKNNRGIFKRIDENRELLELLYEKRQSLWMNVPGFVAGLNLRMNF